MTALKLDTRLLWCFLLFQIKMFLYYLRTYLYRHLPSPLPQRLVMVHLSENAGVSLVLDISAYFYVVREKNTLHTNILCRLTLKIFLHVCISLF